MSRLHAPIMKGVLILGFSLIGQVAIAGGFQVNLQGQRQTGMGHIGTGLPGTAASILFNPGALADMSAEQWAFAGGVSGIVSRTTFRYFQPSDYQAQTKVGVGTPFAVYGAKRLSPKLVAGLGIYTPFGSATEWDPNWRGKHLIQEISLQTVFIQPTISWQANDRLSVGAGFVLAHGAVELQRALPVTDQEGKDGQVNLEGATQSFGFNAGIYYEASDRLSLGFDYRSGMDMEVEGGDASFSVPSSLRDNFPRNNSFSSKVPLPNTVTLGAGYEISDRLTVGIDVNYIGWSVYDSLGFDFKKNTETLQDTKDPRLYENTFIYRLGGEYELDTNWTVRAGGYYDNTPVNKDYYTPETPDGNKIGISVGASWTPAERLTVDASFLFITAQTIQAEFSPDNFGGTYKTFAYIPGVGLRYAF